MQKPRIVYLGTPSHSATVLEGLILSGRFEVVGVVTKPDQPVGRRLVLTPSPVSLIAEKYRIPTHKPLRLNKDYGFIEDLKPDFLLTFAYGQIVSTKVLSLSRLKPLNVHASLLPKYRGAAPIQYALRNGETETGVSLMEMVREMDAGAVYAVKKVSVSLEDNCTSLTAKIAAAGLELVLEYLPTYCEGRLEGVSQDESAVTFCPSIKKEEEHIPLTLEPQAFVDYVRSLSEAPGGYLLYHEEPLKILAATVKKVGPTLTEPGTVTEATGGKLAISVTNGEVYLNKVQKAGKKRLSGSEFLNGERHILGELLK